MKSFFTVLIYLFNRVDIPNFDPIYSKSFFEFLNGQKTFISLFENLQIQTNKRTVIPRPLYYKMNV